MTKPVTNVAASVRQRLLNLARARNEDFGLLLTKYALERMLYRISQSEYQAIFVLKGALLFELWTDQRYRPTRDADFLATGDSDPARFAQIFRELCTISVPDDGLVFDPETITAERIKENEDYEGVRVKFIGFLEKARIPMQMDIGFGDVITPAASETAFPVILDSPAPMLLTYPKETVVAEKFEAMVKLGIANSRMKDFHDVRSLAQLFAFEGELLSEAMRRTFERRKTPLPITAPPTSMTKRRKGSGTRSLTRTGFTCRRYRSGKRWRTSSTSSCRWSMPMMMMICGPGLGRQEDLGQSSCKKAPAKQKRRAGEEETE